MRRGAAILAAALAAAVLGGCQSEPRLASTFPIRADLTVEEALWAKDNLDRLEVETVKKIAEIDVAEIYRATVIDLRLDDDIPYNILAESIWIQISEVELRHYLQDPDAWIRVTVWVPITLHAPPEGGTPKYDIDEVFAWNAFLKRLEPELARIQTLFAQVMKGGPPWLSTAIGKGEPRRDAEEARYVPPPEDGGFWNLGREEGAPSPAGD